MGLPRDLVDQIRRLDEGQLRQVLILTRGLLLTSEEPVVEISDVPGMPTVRYRQKTVRCGKSTCTACPHGPYWYAHWTEDGRRRSRYIGSELPAEVRRKLAELDRQLDERQTAQDGDGTRLPNAERDEVPGAMAASGDVGSAGHDARRRLRLVRD